MPHQLLSWNFGGSFSPDTITWLILWHRSQSYVDVISLVVTTWESSLAIIGTLFQVSIVLIVFPLSIVLLPAKMSCSSHAQHNLSIWGSCSLCISHFHQQLFICSYMSICIHVNYLSVWPRAQGRVNVKWANEYRIQRVLQHLKLISN